MKWPAIKLIEGENPWVTYARRQVSTKNNCVNQVVTGTPGSGKSWSLLSWFCLINPEFDLNGGWFFKASEFMNEVKNDFKPGKLLGLDEGGVDLHNLKYYNALNRGLNQFLQSGRSKNYVFGITVPFISLISKGVRCLMTSQWTARGWNRDNQSIVIPRLMEFNDEMDKFYRKRLIIKDNGEMKFCNKILLPKPPKQIRIEYEKLKKEFQTKLYGDLGKEMQQYEEKQRGKLTQGLFTEQQENVLAYLKNGLNVPAIAKKLDCSKVNVYYIMKSLKSKGILMQLAKGEDKSAERYKIIDNRGINAKEMSKISQ